MGKSTEFASGDVNVPLWRKLLASIHYSLVDRPAGVEAEWNARYERDEDLSPDEPGGPATSAW